jgi:hypothetical protein
VTVPPEIDAAVADAQETGPGFSPVALRQVGAHLAAHVELVAGTQAMALGRGGRQLFQGAAGVWGFTGPDVRLVLIADNDRRQVVWLDERPAAGAPVVVFAATVTSVLDLDALVDDMARDGRAPTTVMTADVVGPALVLVRRTHPVLEVVTPAVVDASEPGRKHRGWTRR